MKKLLVLFLVLGMTSAASAVSLSLDQATDMSPVAIVSGDLDQDLYIVLVCDGASLTNALGAGAPDISNYSGPATDVAGFYPTNSPAGLPYAGEYWVMATTDDTVYPIIGGEYLTGTAAIGDWVYACWFDEVNFTPTMIGEILLVPEPMTVALLGLGGLLMLRRRK